MEASQLIFPRPNFIIGERDLEAWEMLAYQHQHQRTQEFDW
jgi:hypothetical protein